MARFEGEDTRKRKLNGGNEVNIFYDVVEYLKTTDKGDVLT